MNQPESATMETILSKLKPGEQSPVVLSPEKGGLHKRRASVQLNRSPPKSFTSAFAAQPVPQISLKLVRAGKEALPEIIAPATPAKTPTNSAANPTKTPAATSPSAASSRNSLNSTTTNVARRIILLNNPLLTPLTAGTPGYRFSILTALASHTDVLLRVIRYLPPRTLLYLYSISAPFHYLMDSHFQSFIFACTKAWAPSAELFYPWRCYRELCIDDPALRRPGASKREGFVDRTTGRKSDEAALMQSERGERSISGSSSGSSGIEAVKAVPGFRWLKMVTYREMVAREIVAWLAVGGHRTPVRETVDAVKKLWFLLDIPVSHPRVALIHNTAYFSNQTLYVLTQFFIKLDMYWTDPICYTGGEVVMREFLLAERTLTTLWNYLRGADGTDTLDVLRLWVRHGYVRPARHGPETLALQMANDAKDALPIMGVPAALVGRWGYECWGLGKARLIRPDELVLREGVRRGLELQRQWIRMMRWGFLDENFQSLPAVEAEDVVLSLVLRKKARKEELRREQECRAADVTQIVMGMDVNADADIVGPPTNVHTTKDEIMEDVKEVM